MARQIKNTGLRGLFSDIANGCAKDGRYVFGNYLIKVRKRDSGVIPKYKGSYLNRLYQERKQNGLCIACGERPPGKTVSGRPSVRCTVCLKEQRENAHKYKKRL